MAPRVETFPVRELETSLQSTTKDLKPKSRKLPKDFSLERDCPLYEMVQWSCTTYDELEHRGMQVAKDTIESRLSGNSLDAQEFGGHGVDVASESGTRRVIVKNDGPEAVRGSWGAGSECYPFVRLFRRCVDGRGETFHVETTAWEGRKKWKESERQTRARIDKEQRQKTEIATSTGSNDFARYGSYFWSGK